MLTDLIKLSDSEKEFATDLNSLLLETDMNSVVAEMFVYNAVTLNRLLQVLEFRGHIRAYDKKYIKGTLSILEWQDAENNYDPMKELFSIFGDTFKGKSDVEDK